ncbi:hypothetical protein [uncultured Roseovarius sp.]|uniref:hypothetical protein n=1 Tax=uncultured Roseovarius sp. TaxID=293344 RepID=UPI00259530A5|nr:hypothetical protein [uncultured Roseovarius sp.]
MTLASELKTSTLIAHRLQDTSNKFARFGWYWHPTVRVKFLLTGLESRGIEINIWDSPQIKAVAWLLGLDYFPLPTDPPPELHDLFCIVAALNMYFSVPVPNLTKVSDTLDFIRPLKSDIRRAIQKFEPTPEDGKPNAIATLVLDFSTLREDLENTLDSLEQIERFFSGFAEIPLKAFAKLEGRDFLSIEKVGSKGGRTQNWAAQVIAMKCADIYLTTFGTPPRVNDGHPSFRSFLSAFSVGLPNAEKADKVELARVIERGGYAGVPLGGGG